jgi:hypothetical protein
MEEEDMRLETLKDLVRIREDKKKSFEADCLVPGKKIKDWDDYSKNIDDTIFNLLNEMIRENVI